MARLVMGTRASVAWLLLALAVAGGACGTSQDSSKPTEVETRSADLNLATSNIASQGNGAVAAASSTYSTAYPVSAINDGDRKGLNWGNGGGWNDGTADAFPDSVTITFSGTFTINEVDVFTLQDNYTNPSDPTPSMTFSQWGITAFDVQYWNLATSTWTTVPGGSITGNNLVWRKVTFPAVKTSQIRVQVNAALNSYSRIVEVEAYTNAWSFVGPSGCSANPSNPSALWSGTVLDVERPLRLNSPIYRLASSAGGLFQKNKVGWSSLTSSLTPSGSPPLPAEGLAFSAIATKPSNVTIILGGSGDRGSNAYTGDAVGSGIWRTADGGVTWTNVLPRAQTGNFVYRIVWNKHANFSYVHAATTRGYFRSMDDGQTWTQLTFTTATDVVLNLSNDAYVFLGVPGIGVMQSTNSGQTWSTLLSVPTFNRTMLALSTNSVIYAASEDYSTVNAMALWKTTDAGVHWSQLSFNTTATFNQCWRDIAVATDPNTGQVVIVGCDGVARSTQGGASTSWTDVTTGNANFFGDVHVMKFVDNNTVLVGDDHGYHYSTDQGATWHSDTNAIPIDNVVDFDLGLNDPNTFWTAAWDNGVKRSTDGGATCMGYENQPMAPDSTNVVVDPGDARRVWVADANVNRFRTTDAGATWSTSFAGLPAPLGWVQFKQDQVPSVFIYTQAGKGVYRSTDFGANWNKYPSTNTPDFPDPVFVVAASRWDSAVGGSIIYALFSTSNPMKAAVLDPAVSTTSWTDITTGHGLPTGLSFSGYAEFSVSDNTVGTAYFSSGSRIFKTTNRGQNWSEITGNFPTFASVVSLVENPSNANVLYAATNRGLYKTTDGGATWRSWMNGLPPGGVIPAGIKGKNYASPGVFKVLVGIWGLGIWSRDGSSDDP